MLVKWSGCQCPRGASLRHGQLLQGVLLIGRYRWGADVDFHAEVLLVNRFLGHLLDNLYLPAQKLGIAFDGHLADRGSEADLAKRSHEVIDAGEHLGYLGAHHRSIDFQGECVGVGHGVS